MRQTLVAGNWKMNGSRDSVAALMDGIKEGLDDSIKAEVCVLAPAIFIQQVQDAVQGSPITYGGQDLSVNDKGAFTGEIAGSMLKDFHCGSVAVGHSERRTLHGETDQVVAEKFAAARRVGLRPIFCIGETLEEREQGITNDVVSRQIDAVVEKEGVEALAEGVIAYEPVWAIGTGKTASPEQAQEVHAFIRSKIRALDEATAEKVQILYGGSMNAGNAAELLAKDDIDGGLIGGASLKPEDFLTIARAG